VGSIHCLAQAKDYKIDIAASLLRMQHLSSKNKD
jgi:hypothetical protein